MKKQFVTYEIALKLEELGFDEDCILTLSYLDGCHYKTNVEYEPSMWLINDKQIECNVTKEQLRNDFKDTSLIELSFPLWQQAIDFLREKYLLHIEIQSPDYPNDVNFSWSIHKMHLFGSWRDGHSSDYYIARKEAVLNAIELYEKNL